MRTNTITPITFTGIKAVRIFPYSKKNINRQFLYNEVLDITRKLKTPANFHTKKIELPSPTQAVIARLNELGISFSEVV